jgi:hypothetical protein
LTTLAVIRLSWYEVVLFSSCMSLIFFLKFSHNANRSNKKITWCMYIIWCLIMISWQNYIIVKTFTGQRTFYCLSSINTSFFGQIKVLAKTFFKIVMKFHKNYDYFRKSFCFAKGQKRVFVPTLLWKQKIKVYLKFSFHLIIKIQTPPCSAFAMWLGIQFWQLHIIFFALLT